MPEPPRILAATYGQAAAIRIIGRANFKISQPLRDFGIKMIAHGVKSLIFDLSECQGMDSTILGVFAMIGLEGRDKTEVIIVNADESVRSSLDVVGVSRLCRFAEQPVENLNWKQLGEAAAGATDMTEVAPTVLEAHQTLMELDQSNVPKFKDVVELLESEVKQNNE